MGNRNSEACVKPSRIRAVVLDYGEVLCLRPNVASLSRMARVFGIEPGPFLGFYVSSREPYDQGAITAENYWLSFACLLGVQIDAKLIEKLRCWDTEMWSRINPNMTEWLERLNGAGFKTALLSNMELDMAVYARKHFQWLGHFHHQLLSCELGLIKPDLRIFHECLRRVGVRPGEALFVDDRQVNVDAAEAIGMRAIRFQSVEQLRTELQEMGFEVLPVPDGAKRSVIVEF